MSEIRKTCTKCGEEKPLDGFYRKERGRHGVAAQCKVCHCQRSLAYHRTPKGKDVRRASGARYRVSEKGKLAQKAGQKRYFATERGKQVRSAARVRERLRNPEKIKARRAARYAMSSGKLERQPCEVCGLDDVEAHHEDYSKPLDVRWLCREHHTEHHHCRK